MSVCAFMCLRTCFYVFANVLLCIPLFTCFYVYLYIHVFMNTYMYMLLCIPIHTRFYAYLYVHAFMYTYTYTFLCIPICTCFYAYLYYMLLCIPICACIFVPLCINVHVCLRASFLNSSVPVVLWIFVRGLFDWNRPRMLKREREGLTYFVWCRAIRFCN